MNIDQTLIDEEAKAIISEMGWDWRDTESSARRVAEFIAKKRLQKRFELFDIVQKLIGPTIPVGETREDERRYANAVEFIALWEQMHIHIDHVAMTYENRQEYSMQKIGKLFDKALDRAGIPKD